MSSTNAVVAIPNQLAYAVSKGGIAQLTRAMAIALAPHNIRVNAIGPGSIATDMLKVVVNDDEARRTILSRTPLGRVGDAEEVAKVAVFLASDYAPYVTGQTVYPDGGRLALNYAVPLRETVSRGMGQPRDHAQPIGGTHTAGFDAWPIYLISSHASPGCNHGEATRRTPSRHQGEHTSCPPDAPRRVQRRTSEARTETGHRRFVKLQLSPRPRKLGIRKVFFRSSLDYILNLRGLLETRVHSSEVEFELDRSDFITLGYDRSYEALEDLFRVAAVLPVAPGIYKFDFLSMGVALSQSRELSGTVEFRTGRFFDGRRRDLGTTGVLKLKQHLFFDVNYSTSDIRLSSGALRTHLAGVRGNLALNTRLFGTALVQWNNVTREFGSTHVSVTRTVRRVIFTSFSTSARFSRAPTMVSGRAKPHGEMDLPFPHLTGTWER